VIRSHAINAIIVTLAIIIVYYAEAEHVNAVLDTKQHNMHNVSMRHRFHKL